MSGFIRPELREELLRQSQTIIGAVVGAFGLWVALNTFAIVRMVGWGIVILGAVLVFDGLRRARFARIADGQGPGVVEIDERRISWMSAHFGGYVDLDMLSKVEIQKSTGTTAMWVFTQFDGQRLAVPVTAVGAVDIMDALSALKGIDFSLAMKALQPTEIGRFLIWRAADVQQVGASDDPLT